MRYTPNSVPDPATRAELERIAYAMAQPQVGVVLYEVQQTIPPRLLAGMVCYFAAGVVGADEGLYEYSAGAWVQLAGGGGPPPTTATTPPVDDDSTLIATTAYVIGQASSTPPAAPGAAAVGVSLRYARADHAHAAQVNVTGSSGSCTGNAASATTAAACSGNAATATNAASATTAGACTGNAASATTAAACTGNAATATNAASATTAAACTGNAATATTAGACTGNAATATTAGACTGNAATATSSATQAPDDNSTKIATTAYVIGQASSTPPAAPGAAAVGVSLRYARADHAHAAQVNVTGSSGSCTGNAASATTAGACSGNAASATTAAACSGNAATATTSGACSGNAATATTSGACSGNAATATVLQTARTINGVPFDGSANISLPGVSFAPAFQSAEQPIVANSNVAIAHGLGRVPYFITLALRCKVAEFGYAVGDEMCYASGQGSVTADRAFTLYANAVNVCATVSVNGVGMFARTTGAAGLLTPANWKFVLRAW